MNEKNKEAEEARDESPMERRTFLKKSALTALFMGMTVHISGCEEADSPDSGDDETAPASTDTTDQSTPAPKEDAPPAQQTPNNVNGVISDNHGHTTTITGVQLAAGDAFAVMLTCGASHKHTVSLSSAQVAAIAAGNQVSKFSSIDFGHKHTVTFN